MEEVKNAGKWVPCKSRKIDPAGAVRQGKNIFGMKDNRPLQSDQKCLLKMIQMKSLLPPLSAGVIQARVPDYMELSSMKGKLDVKIMKEKLQILLTNLIQEKKIPADAKIDELVGTDGTVDPMYYETLFGKVTDSDNKTKVYHDPHQYNISPNAVDSGNLEGVLANAQGDVDKALGAAGSIGKVFQTKESQAKENYGKIKTKLEEVKTDIAGKVTTDYNGDDEQNGLGGYAVYDDQKVHLDLGVLTDSTDSKLTLIHECAHLADNAIDDLGYYGTPGFESISDDKKINNAAHYEVVPGWEMGTTAPYPKDMEFIPMDTAAPKSDDELTKGKKAASDYFETAWSNADDYSSDLRNGYLNPILIPVNIEEISEKLGLTVHIRSKSSPPSPFTVELLDITLMQDIVRTLNVMGSTLDEDGDTAGTVSPKEEDQYKEYFIQKTIGTVLGRAAVTRGMIDWIVSSR